MTHRYTGVRGWLVDNVPTPRVFDSPDEAGQWVERHRALDEHTSATIRPVMVHMQIEPESDEERERGERWRERIMNMPLDEATALRRLGSKRVIE